MRKGGEITGLEQVICDGASKGFAVSVSPAPSLNSLSVSSISLSPSLSLCVLAISPGSGCERFPASLQNLMLQHATIDMFLKHSSYRNITADIPSL